MSVMAAPAYLTVGRTSPLSWMPYFLMALLQPVLLAFLATVPLVASDSGIVLFLKGETRRRRQGRLVSDPTEYRWLVCSSSYLVPNWSLPSNRSAIVVSLRRSPMRSFLSFLPFFFRREVYSAEAAGADSGSRRRLVRCPRSGGTYWTQEYLILISLFLLCKCTWEVNRRYLF